MYILNKTIFFPSWYEEKVWGQATSQDSKARVWKHMEIFSKCLLNQWRNVSGMKIHSWTGLSGKLKYTWITFLTKTAFTNHSESQQKHPQPLLLLRLYVKYCILHTHTHTHTASSCSQRVGFFKCAFKQLIDIIKLEDLRSLLNKK